MDNFISVDGTPTRYLGTAFLPEGALIRLDREVYGLVSGMSGWRSRIVSQLKEEGYEMNVYGPCLFSKFAVREEPAVDGGSIAPGEFVGCVLLEVDDHLMGGPGKAHYDSMERLRRGSSLGSGTGYYKTGRPFSEDATSHSYLIEASRLT